MAIKEKTTGLEWSVDSEVQLFHAMRGHKPVGVNRHFQMACIHEKFSNSLNKEIHSQQIWNHLDTMYDLAALHESEILPFPNNEMEFVLPNSEFGEMIKTKNGGVELPVMVKQEVRNEAVVPEVRSKSGKELSNRMKMETAPKTERKSESEPSPKAPSSGGKTFTFGNGSGTPKNSTSNAAPSSRGGKDSNSKKNEAVTAAPKSTSKGTSGNVMPKPSKPETNIATSSSGTKSSKDGKSSKNENSSSKKDSSGNSSKNAKEGGSSSKSSSKDSQKGGKDSTSSSSSASKNAKSGKDSSGSTKHSKDSHKGGKEGHSSKNVKDGHKGGKETPSRSSKADNDDSSSSSKTKKHEKEDTNLRKRKRPSRQDASKSNSPVNTPNSKRRRT